MQSCLGIYIEENLIKYAKVQKDKESIKIEAFGTKFYENIQQAINQIVVETNSVKVPIAINISEEYYDYFEVFALLNKQALKKSIEIEFEMLCQERGLDCESMERRHIFVLNQDNPDKMRAINVSVKKDILEESKKVFNKYNLTTIEPLPISLMNLIQTNNYQNELIVNMEENTTLTFIQNGQIEHIDTIKTSIKDALDSISKTENSKTKAYDLLKNITITNQDLEIMRDENEYMDIIVPVLFNMLNEIKEKISEFGRKISKIYFSGTGVIINNLDMYFQDKFNDIECQIVKPPFINSQSLKIGIKDYIEVNSAISLALSGFGIGTSNDLNFENKNSLSISGMEITGLKKGKQNDIKSRQLEPFEKLLIRISSLLIIFILCYSILGTSLIKSMNTKINNTKIKILETNNSIDSMEKNKNSIEGLTSEYKYLIARFNNESTAEGDSIFRESELPNFLTKLATTIPTEVKLVSVENTKDRHIVIQAKSLKYKEIGYFQAILKLNNILSNVSGSTGIRYHDEDTDEEYILVTIEGDLV